MAESSINLLPDNFYGLVASQDIDKTNEAALDAMSRLLDEWISEPEHGLLFENKLRLMEQRAFMAGRVLPKTKDIELAMIVGGLKMAAVIFKELFRADQQDDEVYSSIMESAEPDAMIYILEVLRENGDNGLSIEELSVAMDCEQREMIQTARVLINSGAVELASPETRPTYHISKAGIRFLDAKDIWESLFDEDDNDDKIL